MKTLAEYLAQHVRDCEESNFDGELQEVLQLGIKEFELERVKHYIFLTIDGITLDGAGRDIQNCQQISDIVQAKSALDAYNYLLTTDGFFGEFDTCFCYELADDGKVQGRFDLISDQS